MPFFKNKLNVLLVSPATPPSYWGFQGIMRLVGVKAVNPPLALITVAALLPRDWPMKYVDMNIEPLRNTDIIWADIVLVTGMVIQSKSMATVLKRCRNLGVPTVVGGPLVSSMPEAADLAEATALAIGEAEDPEVVARLVADLRAGSLRPRYVASGKPDMRLSPVPRYDLLRPKAYYGMTAQVSRGCPHGCEFCNVRVLFGARNRYKTPEQAVAELQALHDAGFRGEVFYVDDNFIGNLKEAGFILQAIRQWQESHGMPFVFSTEADIRLASHDNLCDLMVAAGFSSVFVGLESPSSEALQEVRKMHNLKVDVVSAVRHLRQRGLMVAGGYILGFDADGPDVFARTAEFIEACRTSTAMAGLLVADPGTPLERRLQAEGRLLSDAAVDENLTTNIVPKKLTRLELIRGYRQFMAELYSPQRYFDRAAAAIEEYQPAVRRRVTLRDLMITVRSLIGQGLFSSYRRHYWRFLWCVIRRSPDKLNQALAAAISGHHFINFTKGVVVPRLLAAEGRLTA